MRGIMYEGPGDGPPETSGYRQARQESGCLGNVPQSCGETRKNSFMIISMKFFPFLSFFFNSLEPFCLQSPSCECFNRILSKRNILRRCNFYRVAESPLCMGFSRQGYWSGLSRPSPGDLPNSGIKPKSPMSPLAGEFFTTIAI